MFEAPVPELGSSQKQHGRALLTVTKVREVDCRLVPLFLFSLTAPSPWGLACGFASQTADDGGGEGLGTDKGLRGEDLLGPGRCYNTDP